MFKTYCFVIQDVILIQKATSLNMPYSYTLPVLKIKMVPGKMYKNIRSIIPLAITWALFM